MVAQVGSLGIDIEAVGFLAGLGLGAEQIEAHGVALLDKAAGGVCEEAIERSHDRTGRMKRGWKARPGRDKRGEYRDIENDVFYVIFEEFGTVHSPPNPMLRPPIERLAADGL